MRGQLGPYSKLETLSPQKKKNKKKWGRAVKVPEWLRALADPTEDSGLSSSILMAADNYWELQFQGI